MQAIILAGGFGTRLSHIVKDVPKPMAIVSGKPFLTYIVKDLAKKGVDKIVMAVGYKKEAIIEFFSEEYADCKIIYSVEEKPLFTGGAIKKALDLCNEEEVLIINGDTFFDVDIREMLLAHKNKQADMTVACKQMREFDRYGTVDINDERIVAFNEKGYRSEGIINGGIYIINKNLLNDIEDEKFSFEKDFMEKETINKKIYSFLSDGYFIDIGIEADYYKAQEDFKEYE